MAYLVTVLYALASFVVIQGDVVLEPETGPWRPKIAISGREPPRRHSGVENRSPAILQLIGSPRGRRVLAER